MPLVIQFQLVSWNFLEQSPSSIGDVVCDHLTFARLIQYDEESDDI